MRKFSIGLLLALAAPAAFAVAPEHPEAPYREGEVLVQYRDSVRSGAAEAVRARYGLVSRRALLRGRAELLSLPRFTTTAAALEVLRREPAVAQAEPNFRRYARAAVPNDPLFGQQWGLRNTGQPNFVAGGPAGVIGADLNMAEAWDANDDGVADRTGSPAVIVAVIDDAVEVSHPDLAPNVVSPHNFVPCQNPNDPSPVSADGSHGTRVAGCATARGNNGLGVAGTAWHAGLMPLKFGFDLATELAAIDYARDHGAKIINASFGGPGFSQMERDLIAEVAASDVLFVAAGGNDDSNTDLAQLNYPANYAAENIVAVAATNRQDDIASFSQYGPLTMDVAAPGLQIVTTAVGGTYTTSPGTSGTSFSAPYVAGIAALIKSHVTPTPGQREIKARLIESGSAVSGANPRQRTAGGRVDAARAIEMAPRPSLVLRSFAVTGGDGNGVLDPGESATVEFVVRNLWQSATGVTATLTADSSVTVTSGPTAAVDIPADGEATLSFDVTVDAPIAEHRYVRFSVALSDSGSYTATRSYLAEIGSLVPGTPVEQAFSGSLYDEFHAWHVDVPPAAQPGVRTLVVRTRTPSLEDIDLLAKLGLPPLYSITVGINPETTAGFFCTSGTADNCEDPATLVSGRLDGEEAITVVDPPVGPFHLVIVNFDQQPITYGLEASVVSGDLRPDAFAFTDRTGVAPNQTVVSNEVAIGGIDTPTFVTVVGGEYSIDGGPFTGAEGTVANGQRVRVRATTGTPASARVQLTVGGVTDTFTVNATTPTFDGSADASCPAEGGGGGALPPLPLALLLMLAWWRRRA